MTERDHHLPAGFIEDLLRGYVDEMRRVQGTEDVVSRWGDFGDGVHGRLDAGAAGWYCMIALQMFEALQIGDEARTTLARKGGYGAGRYLFQLQQRNHGFGQRVRERAGKPWSSLMAEVIATETRWAA